MSGKLRLIDVLVLVIFISTAFVGIYLFREDFMKTMDARDMEPAGVIVVRNNIVQRRHADRLLWDRIFVDSPVYPGDLIRAAELSSTNIDIDNNEIFLNENTLIRIQQSMGGSGNFLVELREGNLSVTSGLESSGITLDLMGTQIQTSSGTVLNAEVDDEGLTVQVSEGKAEVVGEIGEANREISQGTMIALDTQGIERQIPSAVVIQPVSNARYLNNKDAPIPVNFLWNRINLEEDELLRMEIAGDVNFSVVFRTIEDLYNSTQVYFSNGRWFWRLTFEDRILNRGQINIIDSQGTTLVSPVTGSVFRYQSILPQIRFQWEAAEGASGYLIEINNSPDFSVPFITRESAGTSFVYTGNLFQSISSDTSVADIWYWRVKPLFSFSGESSFSSVSSFTIEKTVDIAAPLIEIPVIPASREAPPSVSTQPPGSGSAPLPGITQLPGSAQPPGSTQPSAPPVQSVDVISRPRNPRSIQETRRYHTVRPGDTLSEIAWFYYNDYMQLFRISQVNNIEDINVIHVGEVFLIP